MLTQLFGVALESKRSSQLGAGGISILPLIRSASPSSADRSRLLPEPVRPEIMLSSPSGKSKLTLRKENLSATSSASVSADHVKVAFTIATLRESVTVLLFSAESRYFCILLTLTNASKPSVTISGTIESVHSNSPKMPNAEKATDGEMEP